MSIPDSPRAVSRFLDEAFAHQRGLGGRITRLRPYICPFEELLRRMPAGASVLDVGCGVGIMSALALGPGRARRVFGFDISSRAIEIAKGMRVEHHAEVTFQALPAGVFPDEQFDVVLCVDVLHHVPPPAQRDFLRKACDRVRAGGLLLLKDISPRPRWKACANRLHDLIMARQWVNYRHEDEVAAWLREIGGNVQESVRLDRLWYSHYLIVWRKAHA